MMGEMGPDPVSAGSVSYDTWRTQLEADPSFQAVYAAEAAKQELGLQLAEARIEAGVSQEDLGRRVGLAVADVERIESGDLDAYPLSVLARYVMALGNGYVLTVRLEQRAA